MNLTQWDKEIGKITGELLSTLKLVNQITNESSKGVHKLAAKSEVLQTKLNDNLEKIIYLSNPTEMLKPQEQSLMYWATNYAEKTQSYIKKYSFKSLYTMWAKLINRRLIGESSSLGSSINSIQDGITYLRSRGKRQEKSQKITISELHNAATKKEKLTSQYNDLVLVRANRDAAGSFQELLGPNLKQALFNPTILSIENIVRKGCYRNYVGRRLQFVKENQKLSKLTYKSLNSSVSKRRNDAVNKKDVTDNSFEQLAQKIMDLNHTITKKDPQNKKVESKTIETKSKRKKRTPKRKTETNSSKTSDKIQSTNHLDQQPAIEDIFCPEKANKSAIDDNSTPMIDFNAMKDLKPSSLNSLQ